MTMSHILSDKAKALAVYAKIDPRMIYQVSPTHLGYAKPRIADEHDLVFCEFLVYTKKELKETKTKYDCHMLIVNNEAFYFVPHP